MWKSIQRAEPIFNEKVAVVGRGEQTVDIWFEKNYKSS
jgi:hypothetical protein